MFQILGLYRFSFRQGIEPYSHIYIYIYSVGSGHNAHRRMALDFDFNKTISNRYFGSWPFSMFYLFSKNDIILNTKFAGTAII